MPRDTVLQGPVLSKNPPEQSSDNAAIRIDHHGKQLVLTWEQGSRGLLAVGQSGIKICSSRFLGTAYFHSVPSDGKQL